LLFQSLPVVVLRGGGDVNDGGDGFVFSSISTSP
jgi:hypothetical protein